MHNEYIIINKTEWLKAMENNRKPAPHWDGIYVSDAQNARAELIEEILSQSTPLIPEVVRVFDTGFYLGVEETDDENEMEIVKQNYILNLKLNI